MLFPLFDMFFPLNLSTVVISSGKAFLGLQLHRAVLLPSWYPVRCLPGSLTGDLCGDLSNLSLPHQSRSSMRAEAVSSAIAGGPHSSTDRKMAGGWGLGEG